MGRYHILPIFDMPIYESENYELILKLTDLPVENAYFFFFFAFFSMFYSYFKDIEDNFHRKYRL